MGKMSILVSFWLAGFVIGVLAWYAKSPFIQFFQSYGFSAEVTQGMFAGLFGSFVMVLTVVFWAFLTSSK